MDKINSTASVFGLLSDPSRIKLLKLMLTTKNLCVSELSVKAEMTLSATSHQLRKLEFLGIVESCRNGKEICYCINEKSLLARKVIGFLRKAGI